MIAGKVKELGVLKSDRKQLTEESTRYHEKWHKIFFNLFSIQQAHQQPTTTHY
jgi:hypothetical protein